MLHTISSESKINFDIINKKDAVLFWQNGIIYSLNDNTILNTIVTKTTHCYALENDITARGFSQLIDKRVKIVSMSQVIELTEQFHPQIKW